MCGIGVGLSVGQWRKPTLTARVLPIIIKTKKINELTNTRLFLSQINLICSKKQLKGEMIKMESKKYNPSTKM